jgi:ABC-type multidrug transport system ATPase subunit
VIVLGDSPGKKNHGIPGNLVGYAPQKTSLPKDLTIKQTLEFYASLYDIDDEKLKSRKGFLLKLLELPEEQMVHKLSGGQKRRYE